MVQCLFKAAKPLCGYLAIVLQDKKLGALKLEKHPSGKKEN